MVATRQDIELRRRVQAELDWEPDLRDEEIALTVRDGVVTLWGRVSDPERKQVVEAAARRVPGVKAVADELRVRAGGRSDGHGIDVAHTSRRQMK